MTQKQDKFKALRQKVDKLLGSNNDTLIPEIISDIYQVIHELDVYRIELELQNEELLLTQEKLQAAYDDYLNLYNFSPVTYVTIDDNGRIIRANNALAALVGTTKHDLQNTLLSHYVQDSDQDILYLYRQALLNQQNQQACEFRLKNQQGNIQWVKCEGFVRNDTLHHEINLVLTDITLLKAQTETLLQIEKDKLEIQLKIASEELCKYEQENYNLRIHAEIDPLTKLANRKLLYQRMDEALALAKRFNDNVAVLFLDLDGFKQVNDHFGHGQGDEVLIEVAKRLRQCVRESDTVARLGGDEFVIILNRTSKLMVTDTAQRILDALAFNIDKNGFTVTISASIGIAIFPDDSEQPLHLLKYADEAMYKAKNRGKHQFCWHLNLSKEKETHE